MNIYERCEVKKTHSSLVDCSFVCFLFGFINEVDFKDDISVISVRKIPMRFNCPNHPNLNECTQLRAIHVYSLTGVRQTFTTFRITVVDLVPATRRGPSITIPPAKSTPESVAVKKTLRDKIVTGERC